MSSAWLNTELETYESHVALSTVGQAAAIREAIRLAVEELKPESFLYLGCAGGNGLEAFSSQRVVGLDLNETYLDRARQRFPAADFMQCDLNQTLPALESFELAFGALVFEYIENLNGLLDQLAERVNGHLVVLLLATRQGAPAVSDSPYRELLQPVGREFRYLSVEGFLETAALAGFEVSGQQEIALPAGKYFVSIKLRRRL
jgi:hypothetical protein